MKVVGKWKRRGKRGGGSGSWWLVGGSWMLGNYDIREVILLSRGSFRVVHRFPQSFVDGNQA